LKSTPAKSIKRLSESMEVSERSLYRYMELLVEVGFVIQKDSSNRYYLNNDHIESFTKEEAELISQSISSNNKSNPLVKSIRTKLVLLEEMNVASNEIVASHYSKVISKLREAIETKSQVILSKYQSASTESVSDRFVEPVSFSSNFDSITAFEVESGLNKFFKIERIGDVQILDIPFEYASKHESLESDIFGFNDTGVRHHVKLQLSMRASLWLKDDYPLSLSYMNEVKDGHWILEVDVFSMEPINRIVRSMPDDIEML
jgi:predicted DNA-binding transcriptional regulator YafY